MSAYNLRVIPTGYKYRGQSVPVGLTMRDTQALLRGRGMTDASAAVMALQDNSATFGAQLAYLVQLSGDQALMRRAEALIETWNDECNDFLSHLR